jgi:Dit-like tail protein
LNRPGGRIYVTFAASREPPQEARDDYLTITEHPIEYGAAITDHAFKRSSEVRVRVGDLNSRTIS